MRPFKKDVYHPFRWRGWFDFGNGGLADICCHAINLPMRALDLGYPEKIVLNMKDGKQIPGKAAVEFHFPARGNLAPVGCIGRATASHRPRSSSRWSTSTRTRCRMA